MTSHKLCGWRAQLSFISAPLGFDTDEGVGADEKGKKAQREQTTTSEGLGLSLSHPKNSTGRQFESRRTERNSGQQQPSSGLKPLPFFQYNGRFNPLTAVPFNSTADIMICYIKESSWAQKPAIHLDQSVTAEPDHCDITPH